MKSINAVVTGASSGIGRAIAIALARAGAGSIVVHYRQNVSGAEITASEVAKFGADPILIAADLSEDQDRHRLVDQAWSRLQRVDTWVNNAGADVLTGDAGDWDFATKLSRLMAVDVQGTILLSRLVAQRIMKQEMPLPASMVFIGWDQSLEGMEGDAGQLFGPIKAAVTAYASSLAQTLAPQARVNTVAPGWIRTAWGEQADEYWDRRAQNQSLMKRWGSPEDVAKAVVFLADPENSFVTGQTLYVNGGWNRSLGG